MSPLINFGFFDNQETTSNIKENKTIPIKFLPSEVANNIFQYLDIEELSNANSVHPTWRATIGVPPDSNLWKNVFKKNFPFFYSNQLSNQEASIYDYKKVYHTAKNLIHGKHQFKFDLSHQSDIKSFAFSACGSYLATNDRKFVHIFAAATGGIFFEVPTKNFKPKVLAFSPNNKIAIGGREGESGSIQIFETEKFSWVATHNKKDSCVKHLAYSRFGTYLVACYNDNIVKIRNTKTHKVETYEISSLIECIAISQDEKILTIGCMDGNLKLIFLDTNITERRTLVINADGVPELLFVGKTITDPGSIQHKAIKGLCFSQDGKHLAISFDKKCSIWSLPDLENIKILDHEGEVVVTLFHQNGNLMVTSSNDGKLNFWQVPEYALNRSISFSKSYISQASFSYDGKKLGLVSPDGLIRVWDFEPIKNLLIKIKKFCTLHV